MRCPGCDNVTTNTVTCSASIHEEAGLCDDCLNALEQQDREYGEYLDNLPLSRKIARKAAQTATDIKIAVHQWNAKRRQ